MIEDGAVRGVRLWTRASPRTGAGAWLHAGDGRSRRADGGRRWPGGGRGTAARREFGLPDGHHQREWAVGMKMVVDLPEGIDPRARHGTPHVRLSRAGDLRLPLRASRTCGHRGDFRSFVAPCPGAHVVPIPAAFRPAPVPVAVFAGRPAAVVGREVLQESGRRGEPFLAGDGYARIGEGSGSTNVLTGSGVDEAWTTGTQLAEAVLELTKSGSRSRRRISKRTYVARRRASWVEEEGRVAEKRPRRLSSRRRYGAAWDGAGRVERRQALGRAASRR